MTSTTTTTHHQSSASATLPTECRPLLIRTAVANDYYSDDDESDHHNGQHHQSRISSSHHQQRREQQTTSSNTSTSSTDWLTVARHTLVDVTRSLPVARNNESRLKTTASTITKIELARQQEQEPSLHSRTYKLPGDANETHKNLSSDHHLGGGQDQNVYDEAVRVRNTLEVVAARIRDAIAVDIRNKLYNRQKDLAMRARSRKLEEEQAEEIELLKSTIKNIQKEKNNLKQQLASSLNESNDREHNSTQRQRNLQDRIEEAQRELERQQSQQLLNSLQNEEETEQRHSIEMEYLEFLLPLVLEQHQTMYAVERSKQEDAHRREREAQQEQSQQETEELLNQQEGRLVDEKFNEKIRDCLKSEEETRLLIESLYESEFAFLSSLFSEESECVANRISENNRAISEAKAEERGKFQRAFDEATSQQQQDAISKQLHQLEHEFEVSTRELIFQWEIDQRESLVQKMETETTILSTFSSSSIQLQKQHRVNIDISTCRSKFFQIWRCWALWKREENYRLDRERHKRILDSAMLLQKSQMETALNPLLSSSQNTRIAMDDYNNNSNTSLRSIGGGWSVDNSYIRREEEEERRHLLLYTNTSSPAVRKNDDDGDDDEDLTTTPINRELMLKRDVSPMMMPNSNNENHSY